MLLTRSCVLLCGIIVRGDWVLGGLKFRPVVNLSVDDTASKVVGKALKAFYLGNFYWGFRYWNFSNMITARHSV